MGLRKEFKKTKERVDKIANIINSTQAYVMYTNGFVLGGSSGGGGGGEPAAYIKSVNLDTTNQIVFTKKNGTTQTFTVDLDDLELSGTTEIESAVVSGDFTLDKGAHFTAGTSAEVTIDCNAELNGDTTFTKNAIFTSDASIILNDNTSVNGLVKELGNEAVSGLPYNFPYHLSLSYQPNAIVCHAYTITLDNNKTRNQYPFTLDAATQSSSGIMTSGDKTKLDNLNSVSGTNDGTNWTSITIGSITKSIPSGGGGGTTVTGSTTRDSGVTNELGKITIGSNSYNVTQISTSSTGTSTTDIPEYITINGTEYHKKKLYQHSLEITTTGKTESKSFKLIFAILNNSNTTITYSDIVNYVKTNGKVMCNGDVYTSGGIFTGWNVYIEIENSGTVDYISLKWIYTGSTTYSTTLLSATASDWTITDTVTQLL